MSTGPLAGVTIVEFASLGPGPYAAMLLADMGASVIRIERPDATAAPATAISQRGRAQRYAADLKNPQDLDCVHDLLRNADALIEGFRPGTMERLNLGPDVVLRDNPRLVYGRITGWGQTGPLKSTAGHDINFISVTGALAAIGPKERPVLPLNLIGDFAGGSMFLVTGMLAALLAARRTGDGQVIDAAMCDGVISLMTAIHEQVAAGEWMEARESNLFDGGLPHYRIYECADGKHLSIGPLEEPFYQRLCESLGLVPPPRRDNRAQWPSLQATFEAIFKTRPRDEWAALLELGDHCLSPVLSYSEAPQHAHLAKRRSFIQIDGVTQSAAAPRFSRDAAHAQTGVREPVPITRAMTAHAT